MTTHASDFQHASPLGAGSADEPPDTLPAEPSHITPDPALAGVPTAAAGDGAVKAPGNEEPEPISEPDLPTDGRDPVGEDMIRNLPRNPDLSEPIANTGNAGTPPAMPHGVKSADLDVLGPEARMNMPAANAPLAADLAAQGAPVASSMGADAPGNAAIDKPATDENQPGFMGQRNNPGGAVA